MKRVVLLEKPFDSALLKEYCDKIKKNQEIYQRSHARFNTRQTASLQSLNLTKRAVSGIVHNISKGGSFLETREILELKAIFKVTIELDKLSKVHTVYAEVIRVSLNAFAPGIHGIGLRFLDETETLTLLNVGF
jgi:response regulator RpfG family c-di-GMP phosphodiesterase